MEVVISSCWILEKGTGGDTGGGNVTGAFTYKNDMKEFVPYVHSAVYNIAAPTTVVTNPDGSETTFNVYY